MTKVPFTPTVYVTLSGRLYRLVEKTKQSCENLAVSVETPGVARRVNLTNSFLILEFHLYFLMLTFRISIEIMSMLRNKC